ncbi:MAG: hypothetical protein KatS3mg095_0737 [Candidatus Parcubacteria bacterium]|nr:MAG: hypothetical protein KatS3mg095_0737 [Candidatus Parcubacteria bacterium]
MNWRLKKQIVYGLIMMLLLSIFILGLWFVFKPAPSCFNNIKDSTEEGIDCGGPCIPCEIANLKLETEKPKVIIYPNNTFDIVVRVKNKSDKYGLRKFKYKFILTGDNNIKAELSNESFILPLQTKYLTAVNIKKPDFNIISADIEIDFNKNDWLEIESYNTKVEMLNYEIKDNKLFAEIINNDSIPYYDLEINFLIYDIFENIIGVLKTKVDYLEPLDRKSIILIMPPISKEINRIDIFPYYNFFKENEN